MSDKRYSKVEEEVLQILDRLEKEEPSRRPSHLRLVSPPKRRRPRFHLPRPRWSGLPSFTFLAAAFGFALLAVLVNDVSRTLAIVLGIASIVSFFAPIFVNRRPANTYGGPVETKTWRGRDITFGPSSGDSAGDRARRWLDRRRGR